MSLRTDGRAAVNGGARLQRIRSAAAAQTDMVLERAMRIAAVPAPTNDELDRSAFVAELFQVIGLGEVETDPIGDVIARVPGRAPGRPVLLAAHLDTVFPRSTPLQMHRTDGRIGGPGIGDNSLGVSCVMAVPEVLAAIGETPAVDILLTGNVGEEGLGNLRGMHAVMDARPEIGSVIAVEGHNLGRVTHVAVGSRRLRVRVTGPGGHSWGDFGNGNAIHAAADIIHELGKISLPNSPKTTLSVGTISGGISVNTIAPAATFDLDLRSIEQVALKRLAERSERIIGERRGDVTASFEVLGERPAGFVPPESRIVRLAVDVLDSLGVQPAGDASSTDANVPIARGVPAVCIGLTTGGNVHREDEYIDIGPVADGIAQLVQLALLVAEESAAGSILPNGS